MSDQPKDHDQPTTRELVYEFLVRYKQEHDGNTPTTREIADGCHVSVGTVYHHLTRLEIENRIAVSGERRRNIEIVGGNWVLADKGAHDRAEHGDEEQVDRHPDDDVSDSSWRTR